MASASSRKYTLPQIHQIAVNGFRLTLSIDVVEKLNRISNELSSDPLIKNSEFNSRTISYMNNVAQPDTGNNQNKSRHRKNGKMPNDEWKGQPFKSTKIDQRVGIDGNIDKIRLYLNKISEKTFLQMRENILSELMIIYENELTPEENEKVCNTMYDFSSSNKFYSNIFADLYSELITIYQSIRIHFENKTTVENILTIYDDIKYVDSNVNYDLYCDNIKLNEKRRSTTQFYINLCKNTLMSKEKMVVILVKLLKNTLLKISEPNNKEEVDELIENIAILYDKDILNNVNEDDDEFMIEDENITDVIERLANSKAKDYKSLSNKAIFKFMDLCDS
jgi:hypothetical protein